MDDHQKELFREVFGESSDSEDYENHREERTHKFVDREYDDSCLPTFRPSHEPIWEQIKDMDGLWLCRNFLSSQKQVSLISAILNEGWFTEENHNQAMRFGDLPSWANELSNHIHNAVTSGHDEGKGVSVLTPALLLREPLFDQLIVNVYQPGEGICAHVDLMRFEDGIALVSLESSCVMHFTPVGDGLPTATKVPVYLTPGSLLLMSGDARYLWKHEINRKPGFQIWNNEELEQKQRISITMRKLCQSCE